MSRYYYGVQNSNNCLMHWKYIRKYKKNGKWRYVYEDKGSKKEFSPTGKQEGKYEVYKNGKNTLYVNRNSKSLFDSESKYTGTTTIKNEKNQIVGSGQDTTIWRDVGSLTRAKDAVVEIGKEFVGKVSDIASVAQNKIEAAKNWVDEKLKR